MSRLFLVRHGQASFFDQDYDKLSSTGEVQSRLLGQYWARHNMSFNRVFSGPRARQRDTASIVTEAYRHAGLAFPETLVLPEFDEYRGDAVLEQGLPRLLESDTRIREFHQVFQQSADVAERLKNFQRLFEVVIGKWVEGEISLSDVESWPGFCARVNRGLSGIVSAGTRGEQVAVFCSGGPVGVAMQRALNLSPRDTLRVVWMSRNSSYSEFLFSRDRFTLSAFNAHPHLGDASLLTYR
jgi:broad specificity phosphatase PhoE